MAQPQEPPRIRLSTDTASGVEIPLLPQGTIVEADEIRGERGAAVEAVGNAILVRDNIRIQGDRLRFDELTDEASGEGNLFIQDTAKGFQVEGPRGRLYVTAKEGEIEQPVYRYDPPENVKEQSRAGHGAGEKLFFEGENRYRLLNGTWTSCAAPDPAWYVRADELKLDYDRNQAQARNMALVFHGATILAAPYAEFPLGRERKSGFLTPSVGMSTNSGFDVAVPYYFNLAPNYDATLTTRAIARRGLQLGGEYRYLTPSYQGQIRAEVLPDDREAERNRALASFQHQQSLGPEWSYGLDFNRVSDKDYFNDLSNRIELSSTAHLVQQGVLNYQNSSGWGGSLLMQQYQTIDREVSEPYRRLPEFSLWHQPVELPGGLEFKLRTLYTQFRHDDAGQRGDYGMNWVDGDRAVLNPSISLPIYRSWWHFEPSLQWHYTSYDLDQPALGGGRTSIDRSVPIASLDMGLAFERDASFFGRDWLQTLEPRIYYVKTPYRRQDDIPLFDTARFGYGFAQIFYPNRYVGDDRISDADQVTVAATTRLLESDTGWERLRLTLGQRYYFETPEVLMPDESPIVDRRTDVLGEADVHLTRRMQFKSFWQYNPSEDLTQRFNAGVRYQAGFARVLNLDYRYTRDLLEDVGIGAQWPLARGWVGVGRLSRSILEERLTEAILGLEYDGGCWVLRTVFHRYALSENDNNTAFFVQLELTGLGSLGSSPETLLRRSVPGYGKISPTATSTLFGSAGGM